MTNKDFFNEERFISVVIPVYNAEKFVTRAVESALSQPETAEIILIEDKSLDGSYAVCQSLAEKYKNVSLYIHENHINKGAGASRNVGIKKAKSDYIAFLDADDFFLEDRFARTKEVLKNKPEADGVYEAIGVYFYSDSAKNRWDKKTSSKSLTTIEDDINPNELFWHQSPIGKKGHTSLDGLTIKRTALFEAGLFHPGLRLHQDTELFMRLAMVCTLLPGKLQEPVSMRGVHSDNRITKKRGIEEAIENFDKMLRATYRWAVENGYKKEAKELEKKIIFKRIIKVNGGDYNDKLRNLKQFKLVIQDEPKVLLKPLFYIYLLKFVLRYLLIKIRSIF